MVFRVPGRSRRRSSGADSRDTRRRREDRETFGRSQPWNEKTDQYANISGLVFRKGDRIIINPLGTQREYGPPGNTGRNAPAASSNSISKKSAMLNIQTQRGCAFRCCYCTYPVIEGHHVRQRTPEAGSGANFEDDSACRREIRFPPLHLPGFQSSFLLITSAGESAKPFYKRT